MYFGPWDVFVIVNNTSDINFPLGIPRKDNKNVGKLIFQQFSAISNLYDDQVPGPGPRRHFWARAWLLGPDMYQFMYSNVSMCIHMYPYIYICIYIIYIYIYIYGYVFLSCIIVLYYCSVFLSCILVFYSCPVFVSSIFVPLFLSCLLVLYSCAVLYSCPLTPERVQGMPRHATAWNGMPRHGMP